MELERNTSEPHWETNPFEAFVITDHDSMQDIP